MVNKLESFITDFFFHLNSFSCFDSLIGAIARLVSIIFKWQSHPNQTYSMYHIYLRLFIYKFFIRSIFHPFFLFCTCDILILVI
uniref:Uncharacterized protein n=1 Tax=Populus trichocarpa TaxID=3694 RepID=A0A2K1Y5L7_POPTR